MTIQQCKYVLKIAKTGSFSEAAKELFVAQSTLSLSIKTLEQELNIRIFERSGNGVSLTEEGAEFERYARQMVAGSDFVDERYKVKNSTQRLHIVTQHYDFIADIFGRFLSGITDTHYNFSLREIRTYDVIQEIESAYSDIGIIAIKDSDYEIMKRYLTGKGVIFTPFLKAAPHVFMRKNHPLAPLPSLRLEELKDYPYLSYDQGESGNSFFTEEIVSGAYTAKHIEISDRATLMNVLLLTDAYTVGTGIMPSLLNRGDIVSVPLESKEFYIIGYILNSDKKLSLLAERFIDSLLKSLKNI